MKRKLVMVSFASAALVASVLFFWPRPLPVPPIIPLRDGGEFRVVQISYTAGPCHSTDHSIGAPKLRWWIYRHLPAVIRKRIAEPDAGIGYLASTHPVLSIWWTHIDPQTHKPEIGEAGDVWMTVDSGQKTNLGWPEPAEDYRQIFITDPPTNSKRLTFEFPIWGEQVHFTIDNPAYRP